MTQAFRFMWDSPIFPSILRELRFWVVPSSQCPWGFILLGLLITFCCGCCLGICLGALVASQACRRLAWQILGVVLQAVQPSVPWVEQGTGALQRRFSQYRA